MSEYALLIFISLRGVVILFFSQVNCADFHRGGRTCFIPKLLNYSKSRGGTGYIPGWGGAAWPLIP